MKVNTAYEPFFSPMVTELNIGPPDHKPKNIHHMFTLKWLVPETQLWRKSTLLPNFLYISNTLSRDLALENILSRDLVPINMDVREICVRRRRPLRRLFVGFVCCHILFIEYLCYRNSRTPAAQCTMGRKKLVDMIHAFSRYDMRCHWHSGNVWVFGVYGIPTSGPRWGVSYSIDFWLQPQQLNYTKQTEIE